MRPVRTRNHPLQHGRRAWAAGVGPGSAGVPPALPGKPHPVPLPAQNCQTRGAPTGAVVTLMARKKSKDTTVDVAPEPIAQPPQTDTPPNRTLLHDWAPLGQCLTQRIGRHYWLRHAAELFADETVPHWVHDNGAMSQRTARVLVAWCQERESAGTLPDQVVVCEIGMGTGLHLKYMLDAFRQHCVDHDKDWYARLQALASDVSAPVARKAQERGLFADHADHVRLGHLDVEAPDTFIELDTGIAVPLVGQVHVFVALYVLDLLGMDVFRRRNYDDGGRWEAVWVRTWLRDEALLPAYTDATVAQLQQLAGEDHPDAVEPLAQVWSLIQEELRAWPVAMAEHPDNTTLNQLADDIESALGRNHALLTDGTVVIHSAGALRAAQLLAETVAEGGIVLLRDVGLHTPEAAATARGLTHYGQVSAAAVNLVQMDAWIAAGHCPGVLAVAPSHDGQRGQCGRLLVKGSLPATESAFRDPFDSRAIFCLPRAAGASGCPDRCGPSAGTGPTGHRPGADRLAPAPRRGAAGPERPASPRCGPRGGAAGSGTQPRIQPRPVVCAGRCAARAGRVGQIGPRLPQRAGGAPPTCPVAVESGLRPGRSGAARRSV